MWSHPFCDLQSNLLTPSIALAEQYNTTPNVRHAQRTGLPSWPRKNGRLSPTQYRARSTIGRLSPSAGVNQARSGRSPVAEAQSLLGVRPIRKRNSPPGKNIGMCKPRAGPRQSDKELNRKSDVLSVKEPFESMTRLRLEN